MIMKAVWSGDSREEIGLEPQFDLMVLGSNIDDINLRLEYINLYKKLFKNYKR